MVISLFWMLRLLDNVPMRDPLLNLDERLNLVSLLPAWTVSASTLERDVTADGFLDAIAWVVAIADVAEELDHHPDIDIRWRTLHLVLSTHDSGGITQRDVELAQRIDAVVG